WATERQAVLFAFVSRLWLTGLREVVARDQALVLPVDERIAMKLVGAGFRARRDDGARCLLVLRLEVLSDDAELLHGVLRERIAAAGVLADHATIDHLVLVADAVDVHVYGIGAE